MKKQKLVTRESLIAMLKNPNPKYVETVVGRALVAINNLQTRDEQINKVTAYHNSVGFSGADADIGTRCAEHYLTHKSLLPWMVRVWTKDTSFGYPKITKYARQLNEIAEQKMASQPLQIAA